MIGLAGLLAGLVIAFGRAASFGRPLAKLAAAARRLGAGDLQERAGPVGGASEIEDLARSFDEMADRLSARCGTPRVRGQHLHQLRTPLTGMKLRLESAGIEASRDVRRQLDAADDEVGRLAPIVDRLLVPRARWRREAPARPTWPTRLGR